MYELVYTGFKEVVDVCVVRVKYKTQSCISTPGREGKAGWWWTRYQLRKVEEKEEYNSGRNCDLWHYIPCGEGRGGNYRKSKKKRKRNRWTDKKAGGDSRYKTKEFMNFKSQLDIVKSILTTLVDWICGCTKTRSVCASRMHMRRRGKRKKPWKGLINHHHK